MRGDLTESTESSVFCTLPSWMRLHRYYYIDASLRRDAALIERDEKSEAFEWTGRVAPAVWLLFECNSLIGKSSGIFALFTPVI